MAQDSSTFPPIYAKLEKILSNNYKEESRNEKESSCRASDRRPGAEPAARLRAGQHHDLLTGTDLRTRAQIVTFLWRDMA